MGALLGLFVLAGFLISPTGLTNLLGQAGTSVAIGQGIQVIGVVTALLAGVITGRANYRKQQAPPNEAGGRGHGANAEGSSRSKPWPTSALLSDHP